jgi:hypothetical protein
MNMPLVLFDPNGMWIHIVVGAGVGALVGGASQVISDVARGRSPRLRDVVSSAVGGATHGAVFAATGDPTLAGAAGGAASTLVGGVWDFADGTTEFNLRNIGNLGADIVTNATIGAGTGWLLGGAGGAKGGAAANKGGANAGIQTIVQNTGRGAKKLVSEVIKNMTKDIIKDSQNSGYLGFGPLGAALSVFRTNNTFRFPACAPMGAG